MSAHALITGLLLAAQVSLPTDRYNVSGGGPAAPKNAAGGAANGTDRIPLFSQPPPIENERTPRNSAATSTGNADPYAPLRESQSGGGQRSTAPSGISAPPAAGRLGSPFADSPQQSGPGASNSVPKQPAVGLKPSDMMRAILSPPTDSQLMGSPVRLVDLVAGARSRLEQTQRVEAYWDLCSSVADYYLALSDQSDLERRRAVLPRVDPAWEQAETELAMRRQSSQRAAVASQMRVAGWLGRGNLPLPADLPHCGSYHTRYEEIFAGRSNAEAQELAALLPLRYSELKDAANSVTRAEAWLDTVARTDADGALTLRALEHLALCRREFVEVARDYNRRIARYTELAAPGEIGAERLIGMMIKLETSSTVTRPTLPAAEPGRQSRGTPVAPPQTFADDQGWEPADQDRPQTRTRDESVVPASSNARQSPQRERSLLVPPH